MGENEGRRREKTMKKRKKTTKWNNSIKGKIFIIVFLVVITNIIIGSIGLMNLKKVQKSLEESLEIRAANLNLLRIADVDLYQMHVAEKDLCILKPDTEEFKEQYEEFNKQRGDIQKKFSEYKENMLNLPDEESLVQNFETLMSEYINFSNEIVENLSSTNTVTREKGISQSQVEGFEKFDALEDALDDLGDFYYDDNEKMLSQVKKDYNQLIVFTIILIMVCLIISTVWGYIVIRSISRQINHLKGNVRKMKDGDLTVKIPKLTNDELGELSGDFNVMVEQIKELITTVQDSVEDMNQSSAELATVSEETTESSEEIRKAILEISEGAAKQALLVEETNQKTLELSKVIETVNEKNKHMDSLSSQAESVLSGGVENVRTLQNHTDKYVVVNQQIIDKVNVLVDSMKSITHIVETLNNISSQTNLLALNAGIEAARAGEYGRGFVVVALEIRKLASQSTEASNEIKDTILRLENEVSQTIELMNQTDQVAKEQCSIVDDTKSSFAIISETIRDILMSIQEINQDILQANELKVEVVNAIQDISQVANNAATSTRYINSSVDGQSAALVNLQKSTELLKQLSEKVNEMIRRFNIQENE